MPTPQILRTYLNWGWFQAPAVPVSANLKSLKYVHSSLPNISIIYKETHESKKAGAHGILWLPLRDHFHTACHCWLLENTVSLVTMVYPQRPAENPAWRKRSRSIYRRRMEMREADSTNSTVEGSGRGQVAGQTPAAAEKVRRCSALRTRGSPRARTLPSWEECMTHGTSTLFTVASPSPSWLVLSQVSFWWFELVLVDLPFFPHCNSTNFHWRLEVALTPRRLVQFWTVCLAKLKYTLYILTLGFLSFFLICISCSFTSHFVFWFGEYI